MTRISLRARLLGWGFILLCLLVFVEFAAFCAVRLILLPRNASLFYAPVELDRDAYDHYMRVRHPGLGWPAVRDGESASDVESRHVPAFPAPGGECLSLYGDSFTYGDEVDDVSAWGNVLSRALDCRVGNYGVGGYGMDQALLRYELNERDRAPIVILGVYPYDMMRNLNQYQALIAGFAGTPFGLKPRYVRSDTGLRLVSLPSPDFETLQAAIDQPETFFAHETFLPDSAEGPVRAEMPYSVALLRFLGGTPFQSWIAGQPSWQHLLAPDHPSGALPIASDIAEAFSDLAGARGARAAVIIFPTVSSFEQHRREGLTATKPFADELARRGIAVVDLHQPIADELGPDGSYCDILTDVSACSGHYNETGNELIAKLVRVHVIDRP